MPFRMDRIVTKGNLTYEVDKPWPLAPKVQDPDDQLTVGPMWFRPQATDAISIDGRAQRGEDGKVMKDEDGETIYEQIFAGDNEVVPAHYEIWCVTKRFVSAMQRLLKREEIDQESLGRAIAGGEVRCVWVYAHAVSVAEELWEPVSAFRKITDQIFEMAKEEKDETDEAARKNGAQAGTSP